MKTKLIISLGAVALVTLSFTFINHPSSGLEKQSTKVVNSHEKQVVGFISDRVVK